MARRETEPLTNHLVALYEGDFEKLKHLYPNVAAGKIIRVMVRDLLKKVELRTELLLQAMEEETVDADEG